MAAGTGSVPAVGVDAGATLAKVASCAPGRPPSFESLPASALEAVAGLVEAAAPATLGLTGGGAAELARRLPGPCTTVNEFAAWKTGASELLALQGFAEDERYLLVSLGTGTSVMLVTGLGVTRVGGTALGGGTVVGLGTALLGESDFVKLCALAARGDRRRVDLLVSDIYRTGDSPLPGSINAASFGKIARRNDDDAVAQPADLAHAVMGLVGENVALICGGLAAPAQVSNVVFGGATLRGNETLLETLRTVTLAVGRQPKFLDDGEFTGALGALRLAQARA